MIERKKLLLGVLIPIVALFCWLLSVHYQAISGTVLQLPVTGYDPRDLLAGHYMTYRLALSPADECSKEYGVRTNYCLCLSEDRPLAQVTWSGKCAERPKDCSLFLRGRCNYTRFEAGIERYYIPESIGKKIPRIPEKATIEVSVNAAGAGTVRRLLIDGEPIEEYAQRIK